MGWTEGLMGYSAGVGFRAGGGVGGLDGGVEILGVLIIEGCSLGGCAFVTVGGMAMLEIVIGDVDFGILLILC